MQDRNIVAHIIAPQENNSLKLKSLIKMGNDLLDGKVENIEEKIDGQNLTFTVINGELQFFNKGINPRRLNRAISGEQPGIRLFDMVRYNKSVRDNFIFLYKALDDIFSKNTGIVEKTFQNGKFVIESSTVCSNTKNTVNYSKDGLYIIQFVSMFGDIPNFESFSLLMKEMSSEKIKTKIIIENVPILEYSKKTPKYSFENDLKDLMSACSINDENTIGDLNKKLTESYLLNNMNIPIGLVKDASERLALSKKSSLNHRMFSDKNKWKEFQEIEERNTVVQAAIAPLEEILQKLTYDILNQYRPKISCQSKDEYSETINKVLEIKKALNENRIVADKKTIKRISDTLKRLNYCDLYRNSEGIVFEYDSQLYKLTGIFTPINKLLGYFKYSDAKII